MRILSVITYYHPHVSGLTIYAERLNNALVQQGHSVTVLTAQLDKQMASADQRHNVQIVRVPVRVRSGKALWMPTFGWHSWRLINSADCVHIHLPQIDAPAAAWLARLCRKPVVLTYHCDLALPPSPLNRVLNRLNEWGNRASVVASSVIIGYTKDYAENSPFLSRHIGRKLHIIPPPVEIGMCSERDSAEFRAKHQLDGQRVIGISARLATEKGIEVLLNALPQIAISIPNVRVLHAGPYKNVAGESAYAARLQPLLAQHADRYTFLGTLRETELAAFYHNLDLLVLPSLNRTESFGLVQIEAMMHGVPVVASNLPGVRQPIAQTGMGIVTPIGDATSLANAIVAVLQHPERYRQTSANEFDRFAPDDVAAHYVRLFKKLS